MLKSKEINESIKTLFAEKFSQINQNDNSLLIENLKEIKNEEMKNLRKIIEEKDEIINTLNQTIKDNKQYLNENKISLLYVELSDKETQINFYKNEISQNKVNFEEQEKLMTKLFYELSLNYLLSKNEFYSDKKAVTKSMNWTIEKNL